MIAVPVWSNLMFLIVLMGFGSLLFLLLLALVPPLRRRVFRHRAVRLGLLWASPLLVPGAAIALYVIYAFWQADRSEHAPESARHVTLTKPRRFAGLEFPVGTRLDLYDAYVERDDNVQRATFPHPVTIRGFDATMLQPDLYGFTLTAIGQRSVEGWQCDLTQPISFRTLDGDNKPIPMRLTRCSLAAGNRVGDIAIPAGMTMRQDIDEVDRPNFVDVALPQGLVFGDRHVPLRQVCLIADRTSHALVRIDEAQLAKPLRIGARVWPVGTEVRWDADSIGRAPAWRDEGRILDIGPWEFQPGNGDVDTLSLC